jgi:hypothetical protein
MFALSSTYIHRYKERREPLTSRERTRALTLVAMSGDWLPLDASLIRVTRKFLHFFTFSRVSCNGGEENSMSIRVNE